MSDSKVIDGALYIGTLLNSSNETYRIESVLGYGGFGITYKVRRRSDGKIMAMKEYFPDQLCERGEKNTMSYLKTNAKTIETGLNDFVTEAKRLNKQNISHPNIVAIDEVFLANNTAYYVMEYIDGVNLYQYIKNKNGNKPMSLDQALSVIKPILQAVKLLHNNRLTHLDIKHENIILTVENDKSLRPVLIDFGQSKHYDKKGRATSALTNAGCSEGFAPPEQYHGLSNFTPQADVYALAATLFFLLTASTPGKSSEINASKILSNLPENLPLKIKNALVDALRKDKDDRTQSVVDFANNLGLDIYIQEPRDSVTKLLKYDSFKGNSNIIERKIGKKSLISIISFIILLGIIIICVSLFPKNNSSTQDEFSDDLLIPDSSMVQQENDLKDSVNLPPKIEEKIDQEQWLKVNEFLRPLPEYSQFILKDNIPSMLKSHNFEKGKREFIGYALTEGDEQAKRYKTVYTRNLNGNITTVNYYEQVDSEVSYDWVDIIFTDENEKKSFINDLENEKLLRKTSNTSNSVTFEDSQETIITVSGNIISIGIKEYLY